MGTRWADAKEKRRSFLSRENRHRFWAVCTAAALFLLSYIGGRWAAPALPVFAPEEEEAVLPVIMYHSILKDRSRLGKYTLSPRELEEDLAYLAAHGWETVSIAQLAAYTKGQGTLPEKPVLLTFDDGFYNNLSLGLPLLEKYGMKAEVSIIGKYTQLDSESGLAPQELYSHLTWEQCRQLQDSGRVGIQNHTWDMHGEGSRHGLQKGENETQETFVTSISEDIIKLQRVAAEELSSTPMAFVYPFGIYSEETEMLIRDLGFSASLTCYEHLNTITRDPECLFGLGRYNRPSGISSPAFFEKLEQEWEAATRGEKQA